MFNLVPVLNSIAPPAGTRTAPSERFARDAITCFDMLDDVVYLGMLDGSVITYHFNAEDGSFVLIQRQKTISTQQHVLQVVALPESQSIAVLADTVLAFYDLAMQPLSVRPLKGITAISANHDERSTHSSASQRRGSAADYLVVARRRTLGKLQIKKSGTTLSLTEVKEVPLPDGAQRLLWHGQHVYLADSTFHYKCLHLALAEPRITVLAPFDASRNTAKKSTDHLHDFRPHMALVAPKELLIACRASVGVKSTGVGVFIGPHGDPIPGRGTLQFPVYPKAIAVHYPHVLLLIPDASGGPLRLMAHSLLTESVVQDEPIPLQAIGFLPLPHPIPLAGLGQVQILARERDAVYALACPDYPAQVNSLLLQGNESAALKLARAMLPAKETRAVVTQVAFGMLNACQWDDTLALLREVRLEPQYLLHMADPDHPRHGRENKEIAAFLVEVKALESFEAIVNLAMHKLCGGQPSSLDPASVASLRASLDESVDRFLLSYLDAWRSTSDAVDPAVEVARLHLLLKLDRGVQEVVAQTRLVCDLSLSSDELQRLADDLAARGHAFAESLVAQRAGDVRRVLDLWQSLFDSTPPATAAPGSEPRWVSVRDVAQLLADLEYAANHASDIQWLLARDRALASHVLRTWIPAFDEVRLTALGHAVLIAYLEDSNGPRDELVRAYLAEGGSVASWLSKYRAASVASHASFPDFLAAQRPASEVRGQLLAVVAGVAGSGDEMVVGKVRECLVPAGEFAFELALLEADPTARVRRLVTEVGDFASAHRVCETEEVPFEVVVDAFLKMDGRDAYSSFFMSVAVKNMDVVDFRELANVLPGDWALERAAPLLMHELAQITRRHRWSTMVKSLERQRNMTTKLAMLAAAHEQPGPITLPAICAGCGRAVDHTDAFVVTHHDPQAGRLDPVPRRDALRLFELDGPDHARLGRRFSMGVQYLLLHLQLQQAEIVRRSLGREGRVVSRQAPAVMIPTRALLKARRLGPVGDGGINEDGSAALDDSRQHQLTAVAASTVATASLIRSLLQVRLTTAQ
ncbi:hypothetical protein H9P43_007775 [Blastocladiella emersonii ATCC 22665]|nr:hypothetical protein H9P43_007775 [Blastocladiella emersonii ATCC 22665]